ncbi:hypothetical protein BX257_1059 [Streptomyces sp. 3212.3]|nr:hypothetical protein BX257_1059 [Streptomyces sp. 3212.3]
MTDACSVVAGNQRTAAGHGGPGPASERRPAPVHPFPHRESGTMSKTLKIMSAIVATLVIAVGCFTQVF